MKGILLAHVRYEILLIMDTKDNEDAVSFFDQLSSGQLNIAQQNVPKRTFQPPLIQKPKTTSPLKDPITANIINEPITQSTTNTEDITNKETKVSKVKEKEDIKNDKETKRDEEAKKEEIQKEEVKEEAERDIKKQESISKEGEVKKEGITLIRPIAIKVNPTKLQDKPFTPSTITQSPTYKSSLSTISNKGLMVYWRENKVQVKRLSSLKEEEHELCINLHKLLYQRTISSKLNTKEVIDCINGMLNLGGITKKEKLLWRVVLLAITHDSISFLSTKPDLQALHKDLISLLDNYKIMESIPSKRVVVESFDLSKEEMNEKTLLELVNKGNWMEAIALSKCINPLMQDKIIERYIEKRIDGNPLYTLLLINQCKPEKIFEADPSILSNWNTHLSFLLRNIEFCNPSYLLRFLKLLSQKLQAVI